MIATMDDRNGITAWPFDEDRITYSGVVRATDGIKELVRIDLTSEQVERMGAELKKHRKQTPLEKKMLRQKWDSASRGNR